VQEALKEHAASVRDPVFLQPLNATTPSNKTKQKVENAAAMWKKIYTNPELYKSDIFLFFARIVVTRAATVLKHFCAYASV